MLKTILFFNTDWIRITWICKNDFWAPFQITSLGAELDIGYISAFLADIISSRHYVPLYYYNKIDNLKANSKWVIIIANFPKYSAKCHLILYPVNLNKLPCS